MADTNPRKASWFARLLETTGVDCLPYVACSTSSAEQPQQEDSCYSDVSRRLRRMAEAAADGLDVGPAVDECMAITAAALARQEGRIRVIESKAYALVSTAGVAAAFTTGFAAILLSTMDGLPAWAVGVAALLYFLVVTSFTTTVLIALKVVAVGQYRYGIVDPGIATEGLCLGLRATRMKVAASQCEAFRLDSGVADQKATILACSQLWFRNSVCLLVAVAALAGCMATVNAAGRQGSNTPTSTADPLTVTPLSAPGGVAQTPSSTASLPPLAVTAPVVQQAPSATQFGSASRR